jgi:hypothetical protein
MYALPSPGAEPTATRQQVLAHLDHLRAVRAGAGTEATERYNRQMDEAWRFFDTHAAVALPVLRDQLAMEIRKEKPNQLLLLDIGFFLNSKGTRQDQGLAREALFALDLAAEIVKVNDKELFEFTHQVAATRDARTLPFVDRAFLRSKGTIFIPQHVLTLDETLVCVFLYGVYGDGAEQHLIPLLRDPSVARRVIEILIWIGSPAAIPDVKAAYGRSQDRETFARITAFMMKAAGPEGRETMLSLRPEELDASSREYLQKILSAVRDTRYESLRQPFGPPDAAPHLTEQEVRSRLATMLTTHGRDDSTEPGSILDSAVPSRELIGELTKIRTAALHRLSDEGLSDVAATNAMINALRYRGR